MTIEHYDAVLELMRQTPGVTVRAADSKQATARYLGRNPGLSFITLDQHEVIACAMCGHDGRRGYLQHVIVLPSYRKRGIASQLVERCLSKLESIGIFKTHIDVFVDNDLANQYWVKHGWVKRNDINRYSFNRSPDVNA
ncbi:GNAT family N-acetyltransferase [Brasilonema sp. UFV-L1]|uniref:GNAT family N-acetyltransferase n=1 Tax=Brasilonema sp. UFV-L1 TaxID=2234130 RepID=UPI00145CB1FF|nr:GNAT family N-acetyltransferase [Brasilonema sp. UFV-L1]NMG05794.1 GNAT family N-acetyltransferase [Brasilonema sp. UFV-L1]